MPARGRAKPNGRLQKRPGTDRGTDLAIPGNNNSLHTQASMYTHKYMFHRKGNRYTSHTHELQTQLARGDRVTAPSLGSNTHSPRFEGARAPNDANTADTSSRPSFAPLHMRHLRRSLKELSITHALLHKSECMSMRVPVEIHIGGLRPDVGQGHAWRNQPTQITSGGR